MGASPESRLLSPAPCRAHPAPPVPARLGGGGGGSGARPEWSAARTRGGRGGTRVRRSRGSRAGRRDPPGRRRHHVPLWQRPLRPVVLLVLSPAQREWLGGVPRLSLQHIGAGAGPRPASPAAVPYRRCYQRFAAAPPPLSVGPPRRFPPLPVAASQPEAAVAAGRNGIQRDAGPPGERARRQRQPGNRRRAAGGLRAGGGCQASVPDPGTAGPRGRASPRPGPGRERDPPAS